MPVNWSWWEPTLWGHITPHSLITTMQLRTVANLMMLWRTMGPALCWKEEEKEQSAYCFFFSLEDIISRWVGVAVNSSQLSPLLLCLEANPLISCVSMDLQRTIFIWERERRKSTSFSFLFFFCAWFVQPLQNGSSVIVLCSWELIWILCRPEWEKMISGSSVCVRSETRDFKVGMIDASSVFVWITGIAMLPLLFLSFKPRSENTLFFVTTLGIHHP